MQIVITVLGSHRNNFITQILPVISDNLCKIIEVRSTRLSDLTAGYLLIEGNWNQIAKLEAALEILKHKLDIRIHKIRPEKSSNSTEYLPYSIETISIDRHDIIGCISQFLVARSITIEEIIGSRYQAAYLQSDVFSTRFVIFIPPELRILSLREEFLDFCDQMNIDAILEPIKR